MTDNIRDIESAMPHRVSEVICVKCYNRWIAVRPVSTRLLWLDCRICGPGYVIETGEVIND